MFEKMIQLTGYTDLQLLSTRLQLCVSSQWRSHRLPDVLNEILCNIEFHLRSNVSQGIKVMNPILLSHHPRVLVY